MKKHGVLLKIILVIIPVFLISLAGLMTISYTNSKSIVNNEIEQNMRAKMDGATETIQKILLRHGKISETLAKTIQTTNNVMEKDNYVSLLKEVITTNEDTLGAGVWFEPYKYEAEVRFFGPYAYKSNGEVVYTDDYSNEEYNYPNQDWYKLGLDKNKSIAWSLPYYDPVAKITMITATCYFLDRDGNILGVTTADMDLTSLQKNIETIKIGETGKAFLIDTNGLYIVTDDKEKIMTKKIQEEPNAELAGVGLKMLQGNKGTEYYTDNGIKYRVYFDQVPNTAMVIGIQIQESELMKPVNDLLTKSLIFTFVFMIAVILITYIVIRRITMPLNVVAKYLDLISQGNLTTEVPQKYLNLSDEVGHISVAMKNMQDALRKLISDMKYVSNGIIGNAEYLSAVSGDMTASSNGVTLAISEITRGTSEQADDLASISGEVSDFGEEVENMVYAINEIDGSANGISNKASISNEQMVQLIRSIEKVSEVYRSFEKNINGFTGNIDKINEITTLINSIADQTNLLALNAAIEAARAGETGKGFAVVADEIRKLAEQSKNSSHSIKELINNISGSMTAIVESTDEINKEISNEVTAVNSTIKSFREIISEIDSMLPKIKSINKSAVQIDHKKTNISSRIEAISAVAEEVSASSQEISASSEEMDTAAKHVSDTAIKFSDMTADMKNQINKFTIES